MDNVALRVNGSIFSGWKDITIKRSMKNLCGSFSLSFTEKWSGQNEPWRLRPGDPAIVTVDGTEIMTGYLDQVTADFGATTRSLKAAGRDRAGDLVDCSIDIGKIELTGLTVRKILQRITEPFGIKVVSDGGDGPVVPVWTIQTGESPQENFARLAKKMGFLLLSRPDGSILMTQNFKTPSNAKLVEGQNILSASAKYDHSKRYDRYRVVSQASGAGFSSDSSEDAEMYLTSIEARSLDANVHRYRPLVIVADSESTEGLAKKRADWESNVRAAQSTSCQIRVQGWRQPDGRLWEVNRTVPVTASWIGINEEVLISEAEFSKGSDGTITTLTVESPEAYTLQPVNRDLGLWKELSPSNAGKSL